MYLLGHIALGYLSAWAVARTLRKRLVLWAVLFAGIVPDFDLLLRGFGLGHATYTHSLIVWAPVALLLVIWRRDSIPYVAALLQHIVVRDIMKNLQGNP